MCGLEVEDEKKIKLIVPFFSLLPQENLSQFTLFRVISIDSSQKKGASIDTQDRCTNEFLMKLCLLGFVNRFDNSFQEIASDISRLDLAVKHAESYPLSQCCGVRKFF